MKKWNEQVKNSWNSFDLYQSINLISFHSIFYIQIYICIITHGACNKKNQQKQSLHAQCLTTIWCHESILDLEHKKTRSTFLQSEQWKPFHFLDLPVCIGVGLFAVCIFVYFSMWFFIHIFWVIVVVEASSFQPEKNV